MKPLLKFLGLMGLVPAAWAQTPGKADPLFDSGSFVNSLVDVVAPTEEGKVYIAGRFTTVRGAVRFRLARMNDDGSADVAFDPGSGTSGSRGSGVNGLITSIALQPDGKLLICGDFTSYNGVSRNAIARINVNGSLDTSFNPGSGASSAVYSISIQPDGKILIGGAFASYNGVPCKGIARLNDDGSLDVKFNSGIGPNGGVRSVALKANGKVVICGNFVTYEDIARRFVAQLNADGSLDGSFDPGTGPNNSVDSLYLQPDGKVLIGGLFSSFNGVTRNGIARLNEDGSLDTNFNPGSGTDERVLTMALQADNKVLIGGEFYKYNGVVRKGIARLNVDGSLDPNFNPGSGASGSVSTVAKCDDGKVLIGGWFSSYNGDSCRSVARINGDGSIDASFAPERGLTDSVRSLAVQPDGKVLVSGNFTNYNGISRNGIARFAGDGSLDPSFHPGSGADGAVTSVMVHADGKIMIGGAFASYNGLGRNGIARLNSDGSLDLSFNPGFGLGASVNSFVVLSMALQGDGKLLIGGFFTSYNGVTRKCLARLNSDGSLDTDFDPGSGPYAVGTVNSIAVQANGKILIGGDFTSFNGVSHRHIVRLNENGSVDDSFNHGAGVDLHGEVNSIALQADGSIIIAGSIQTYNAVTRKGVARLNADGSLDTSFDPGSGTLSTNFSAVAQSDGKVIIVGYFETFAGVARKRIVRLNGNGSVDTGFDPGTGANGGWIGLGRGDECQVQALAVQENGNVLIGGYFSSYNGIPRNSLARVLNDPFTQSLSTVGDSEVFWTRGGSAPEVERVVFHLSSDEGGSWTELGAGFRSLGGWRLAGLALPAERLIRARGFTANGGMVEFLGSGVPNPTVTSVAPTTIYGSDNRQWIAIKGSGFNDASVVVLRTGSEEYVIPTSRTEFVSASELRVFVNFTSIAAEWSAQVRNLGGQASDLFTFQVVAEAISPEKGIDFGTIAPGTTEQRTFTIRNGGSAPVQFASSTVPAPFAVISGDTATLEPGQEHSFVVRYSPVTPGRDERTLVLQIGNATHSRTITGRAALASIGTATVEGVVRGRNALGELVPVNGAIVGLRKMVSESEGYLRWIGRDVVTDAMGRYRIENAPPGRFLVAVDMRAANPRLFYGTGYGGESVDLIADQTETVDFELRLLQSLNPADPKNYPVVLVRGLGNAEIPAEEIAYWQAMRNALRSKGFNQVWDPNEDGDSRINGTIGVKANSEPLWTYVKERLGEYETEIGVPRKVNFICHSMGGLILRQMLHENIVEIHGPSLRLVGDVFMLSTPNAGSLLADYAPPIGDWRKQWRSIIDLRTERFYNGNFSSEIKWPSSDMRLFLLGGSTFEGNSDLEKGGKALRSLNPLERINDGAVTVHSSRGQRINQATLHAVGPIFAFLEPPSEVPTWDVRSAIDPIEVPLNHTTIRSNFAVSDWIAGILLGGRPQSLDLVQPNGSSPPDSLAVERQIPELALASSADGGQELALREQIVESVSGMIAAGVTAAHNFPVDTTAKLRVLLTGNADLGLRLRAPSGATIDPSSPSGNPDVVYSANEGDGSLVEEFDITSPEVGVWQLQVDASGMSDPGEYTVRATVESNLMLETIQREFVPTNTETVFKTAFGTASDGLLAVPGSTVSSVIFQPDGSVLERTIADDGTQGDGEANDGVSGWIEEGFAQPGEHRVVYRAEGVRTESGGEFRRIVERTFLVAEIGGFIAGEPMWENVDADDDGFGEALLATVPVSVNAPGDYILSAILRDDELDREIRAVTEFHRVQTGLLEVSLTFDPRDFPEQTMFGPFELRDIRLFRRNESDTAWLDRYDEPVEVTAQFYNETSRMIRLSGDTDFGPVRTGQSVERTLTIHNDGSQRLEIYRIDTPTGFSTSFTDGIGPGESITVTVTFAPVVEGEYQGDLTVDSNATGGTYRLPLSGEGVEPAIQVTGNGVGIPGGASIPNPGNHTDFGAAFTLNGTVERTFTIRNTGTASLSVGEVSVSGADFAIATQPSATVAPGTSTVFRIVFDPSAVGLRSGAVEFANNVSGQNPFSFAIQGTGTKISQVINFSNPGVQLVTATVNLSATGGASGNPVSFAVTGGPGSISGGNVLSFTGAGPVTITASQAGNNEYQDATPVARTFGVQLVPQTIVFPNPGSRFISEVLNLAATGGGSGNAVTFQVLNGPAVFTNGNVLSFSDGGNVTVRASQAGDELHAAAVVNHTFEVLLPRPDVAVGRSPSSLVGSEVYAPSVQLASLVSTKARPVTGFLALGNRVVLPDGRAADAVVLRGGRGNAFFKVAYLAPTGNETAAVLAGTYQTPLVDADDAAVPLRSVVTPNKKKLTKQKGRTKVILRKTLVLPLSASSSLDPAIRDAASIRVQTK